MDIIIDGSDVLDVLYCECDGNGAKCDGDCELVDEETDLCIAEVIK
ncbi:17352_t:CDS:2 [Racocetra fulgida]|uniref:17352_t:CDS:1 n=1 Tax=Racocetra fulgida TaxID=60492 RepID=A0A9N8VGB5_9GLOM|nr:17352_t:CDS:2 [Racocetra fulgida]